MISTVYEESSLKPWSIKNPSDAIVAVPSKEMVDPIHPQHDTRSEASQDVEHSDSLPSELTVASMSLDKKTKDTNKLHRSVSFDTISIREYSRALGDNPSTTHGPPLTLDWAYEDVQSVSIDEYEDTRPPRRFKEEMMIPGSIREDILLSQTETTKQQIRKMVSQVRSWRHQRQMCVALQDFEEWHEFFEWISRRFRRLRTGVSKKQELESLWEKARELQTVKKSVRDKNSKDTLEDTVVLEFSGDDGVGSSELLK